MTYKAKTISGAQQRVRQLERHLTLVTRLLDEAAKDRRLLARLAAKTPQFSNPIDVWRAEKVRDRVLANGN